MVEDRDEKIARSSRHNCHTKRPFQDNGGVVNADESSSLGAIDQSLQEVVPGQHKRVRDGW